jgi:hypothetical protein
MDLIHVSCWNKSACHSIVAVGLTTANAETSLKTQVHHRQSHKTKLMVSSFWDAFSQCGFEE